MKKFKIVLEGLNCAGCASKIEADVCKIDIFSSVSFNFMKKMFVIEQDAYCEDELLSKIQEVVNKYESDVFAKYETDENKVNTHTSCGCGHDHHEHHNHDEESHGHTHGGDNNIKKEGIKLGLAGILFILGIALKVPDNIEMIILLVAYIIAGKDVLIKATKNILKGRVFDENFLMALATVGAVIIGEYPEAVGVMLFYQVGEMFQEVALNNSRKSIESLMNIRPDYANLKVGNDTKKVSPKDVKVGDIVIVKPGEKIPLDGIIIDGNSMIDTSMLTGESVLRDAFEGDEVLAGCINKNAVLTVRVNKEFEQSTVSKILELVENASSKKAKTEQFITKFARYYTPVVVISALLISVVPPLILKDAVFSDWLYKGLIFLVISCPCALVLSIPIGFFGGIGCASKNGILVKGSNYLEILNTLNTLVLDKTGTLTKGVFNVCQVKNIDIEEDKFLKYAAIAECNSNHPIATSILNKYNKDLDKENIKSYEEIGGFGVVVEYNNDTIIAGNEKLMKRENINYINPDEIGTVVHIAINREYKGYILISDEIKDDSFEAIKAIKSMGVKEVVMLTGDNKEVGESVAKKLGIDKVYTNLLPQDKVEILEKIKEDTSKIVGFVGDGINDAPVLARADVGFAMGALGSDAAIEAADVVLMTDEVSKIASSIKIAKKTREIVWQNIVFALGVKAIVLILGGFGLANMWEAVFADVGVALIAIMNSMRIIKYKF